jgi:cobalt-zinc-cadmium efflux system protein
LGLHEHRTATHRLGLVLSLTAVYAVAEVAGGWLTNSLALLADAGHMLTDVSALALALVGAWAARRPPDRSRTYGYKRVEILAALVNGVALVVIALLIARAAWGRLADPPEVAWGLMAAIAAGGLGVNLVAARLLHAHRHSLNARAAYLHVLGDLLGSIGTLAAAATIALFDWKRADAVIGLVVGAVIVFGAARLVLDSVHVLLEGAPAHLDTNAVRSSLAAVAGVASVHDLHLWSLGGDAPLLTAHLVLDGSLPAERVLRQATALLVERFAIEHATLQVEPPDYNVIESLTRSGGSGVRSR